MKVNYMKMIMAKGVFKMRAAGAGKGVCVCVHAFVCVCNLLCEGGALLPPSLPPSASRLAEAPTSRRWKQA